MHRFKRFGVDVLAKTASGRRGGSRVYPRYCAERRLDVLYEVANPVEFSPHFNNLQEPLVGELNDQTRDTHTMSLFQTRRRPKRVAREDAGPAQVEDDGKLHSKSGQAAGSDTSFRSRPWLTETADSGPVVRRPGALKQKSKLRVSFDPTNEQDDSSALPSESEPSIVWPLKRGTQPSLQDRLKQTSIRGDDEVTRPIYSKSALDELRASTPSTPKDLSLTTTPEPSDNLALSVESKFGKLPATATTAIPSATEIAERKARRARLALEQSALPASTTDPDSEDYIPLDAYDSDGEFKPTRLQVSTWHQPTKEKDTRLVHEDEDIAEGFESFTEATDPILQTKTSSSRGNNRLTTDSLNLTSRSARANASAQRDAMRAAIDAAEGASSTSNSDSDDASDASDQSDDDRNRNQAYELSQASHALPSSLSGAYAHKAQRPQQPKTTTPIMKLSAGLQGLRDRVTSIGVERDRLRRELAEVRKERVEVLERKEFIQRSLETAAKELEAVDGNLNANNETNMQ